MAGAKVPLTFRIFKGDQLLREERLSLSVIKLGKVPSAHLKLDDETVSRMHAIIEVNGPGDVSIIDLGSTKGTFVNGQKVNKAKLQSGDTIVVGETRIELAIGASEDEDITRVNAGAAPPVDVIASTPRPPGGISPTPQHAPTMQAPPPPPVQRPLPAPAAAAPPPMFQPQPQQFAPAPASVRPPPGLPGAAPIFGTAMAPPVNFQQAMAESVDDLSGARAVEVAAMLGDSVVGVKHCMDPKSGKITPTTYGFFAAGALALVMSIVAFGMGVSNATAYEEKKAVESTCKKNGKPVDYECVPKPVGRVRPIPMSLAWDWLAIGGLASSIFAFAYGLARMHGEKQSPFFRIGTAPGVEFPTDGAPSPDFPLIAPTMNDFSFNFAPGMEGEMVVNGQTTSLQELAAQGRTSISPIPPNAKIRVRAGKTTFLVSAVPQPRRAIGAFGAFEAIVLAYFGGSAVVHMIILLIAWQVRGEDSGVNVDYNANEDLSSRSNSASQDDPPPPEEEDKPDDGEEESGGSGQAMALEEGKMGKKESTREEGQYKMKNENADPQLARQQAIEQARTSGILGSTLITQGGAFASLTGTGDISSGFDDQNIFGGLLGNEAGEMNGGFGFGRSGFGPGGGGTGWGTIGTGRYGTIGHGSGTGSGYGVGGGRGGMRGRSSAVPPVTIGQPTANGDLDKAIIRRYIKRNLGKIQYCYEKELLAKSNLAGTVSTNFFITPNGNVAQASGAGVDPSVANCVANVIKGIEFPKPKNGGGVQVSYPFTFRPAGS
jgi:hypothetical protein